MDASHTLLLYVRYVRLVGSSGATPGSLPIVLARTHWPSSILHSPELVDLDTHRRITPCCDYGTEIAPASTATTHFAARKLLGPDRIANQPPVAPFLSPADK